MTKWAWDCRAGIIHVAGETDSSHAPVGNGEGVGVGEVGTGDSTYEEGGNRTKLAVNLQRYAVSTSLQHGLIANSSLPQQALQESHGCIGRRRGRSAPGQHEPLCRVVPRTNRIWPRISPPGKASV